MARQSWYCSRWIFVDRFFLGFYESNNVKDLPKGSHANFGRLRPVTFRVVGQSGNVNGCGEPLTHLFPNFEQPYLRYLRAELAQIWHEYSRGCPLLGCWVKTLFYFLIKALFGGNEILSVHYQVTRHVQLIFEGILSKTIFNFNSPYLDCIWDKWSKFSVSKGFWCLDCTYVFVFSLESFWPAFFGVWKKTLKKSTNWLFRRPKDTL